MHVTDARRRCIGQQTTTRLCCGSGIRCPCAAAVPGALINDSASPPHHLSFNSFSLSFFREMEVIYRPLLPPTQYCPCDWRSSATELNSLPHSQETSPFFRSLFAPFTPPWINPNSATTDNSPDVSQPSNETEINHRAIFERQKKLAARSWDSTFSTSVYIPGRRWLWTHQVPFEDRPEEVPITCMCAQPEISWIGPHCTILQPTKATPLA
jgi:hypothetical protein